MLFLLNGGGGGTSTSAEARLVQEWQNRSDVTKLREFCVALEAWRQGVKTRLNLVDVGWRRDHGFRTLALNTTLAQIPAMHPAHKLNFREMGRTSPDDFESMQFELMA